MWLFAICCNHNWFSGVYNEGIKTKWVQKKATNRVIATFLTIGESWFSPSFHDLSFLETHILMHYTVIQCFKQSQNCYSEGDYFQLLFCL